jgi:hypothetical protein
MNVQTVTNRDLRALAQMKGRLESDLNAVKSTLETPGGDSPIPTGQITAEHRKRTSRGIDHARTACHYFLEVKKWYLSCGHRKERRE